MKKDKKMRIHLFSLSFAGISIENKNEMNAHK